MSNKTSINGLSYVDYALVSTTLENIRNYFLCRRLILPVFRENEAKIDQVVKEGKEKLVELTKDTLKADDTDDKKSS